MRLSFFAALATTCALSTLTVACGDDHSEETFDTLTECVDDHASLGEPESIAHCLLDYPFGDGLTTVEACVAYVTANGGYPDSRDAACADFIEESGL